jgi:hypothetical protein
MWQHLPGYLQMPAKLPKIPHWKRLNNSHHKTKYLAILNLEKATWNIKHIYEHLNFQVHAAAIDGETTVPRNENDNGKTIDAQA